MPGQIDCWLPVSLFTFNSGVALETRDKVESEICFWSTEDHGGIDASQVDY
jgi:hypothetical protein